MDSINLKERHKIEEKFHDDWARSINVDDVYFKESFEAMTALENQAVLKYFGDLKNKKVLDMGCGAGEASVYFASKGADVSSIDISREMLNKTEELAKRNNQKVQTFQSVAEKLDFDENTFDCIYGSSILHHADIKLAVSEAARVLKKDGTACFVEPLSYNFIINVYREMAHEVRTETEAPFNFKDFKFIDEYFSDVHFDYYWFATLSVFLYMYFIERINPSEDRYWKRIIREQKRYEKMFNRLNRFDQKFLKTFPFMNRYCWTTVITLQNKKDVSNN